MPFARIKSDINSFLHKFFYNLIRLTQNLLFHFLDLFRPLLEICAGKVLRNLYGIELNGDRDYDLKVHDGKAFAFILSYGFSGFAISFVEKYLDCKDFELFMSKICEKDVTKTLFKYDIWSRIQGFINKTFDVQTLSNAKADGGDFYDEFGERIKIFSGPNLLHSCCNFDNTDDVEQAELDQLKSIANKLQLKPGMNVLDIGCGFGALANYLGSNYDVTVTGVTISSVMANTSKDRCKHLSNVSIIESDYREITGKYDRITCIEMMEHIGDHHYTEFFSKVNDLLVDDGLFILQVVSTNQKFICEYNVVFADFYGMKITFPNIAKVIDKSSDFFVVETIRNIGYNYGKTCEGLYKFSLESWWKVADSFDSNVVRMGLLYGGMGSAVFKHRYMQNNQIVFSKGIKYQYKCNKV